MSTKVWCYIDTGCQHYVPPLSIVVDQWPGDSAQYTPLSIQGPLCYLGPYNLGLAAVACGMFYKVDSLAVDKDITLISQVLLA